MKRRSGHATITALCGDGGRHFSTIGEGAIPLGETGYRPSRLYSTAVVRYGWSGAGGRNPGTKPSAAGNALMSGRTPVCTHASICATAVST